jgi:hypothetical protein
MMVEDEVDFGRMMVARTDTLGARSARSTSVILAESILRF